MIQSAQTRESERDTSVGAGGFRGLDLAARASFLGREGRVGKNGNLEDFYKIELFKKRKGVAITPKSKSHKRKKW